MSSRDSFDVVWSRVSQTYADSVAYYTMDEVAITYRALAAQAKIFQKECVTSRIVFIDGQSRDWLAQSIAAWSIEKVVCFFNGENKKPVVDVDLYDLDGAHAIFFTSGSTGNPKAVVRTTAFALFEAEAYMADLALPANALAVSQVAPWFGAMTKHTLGMLLQGIPQFFHIPPILPVNKTHILYCTPSQLTFMTAIHDLQWDIISLTGEPLNALHVNILKQCLKSNGWVLDSLGQTECGVIARRKQAYNALHRLTQNFSGEILPGKKVYSHENHRLSIELPQKNIRYLDDLGVVKNNQIILYGRASAQRKIRGVWVNAGPLLELCRSHHDIYHVELSPSQTEKHELILYVIAKSTLTVPVLHAWIVARLVNMCLLPQIIMSTSHHALGRTGKLTAHTQEACLQDPMLSGVQVLADLILTLPGEKHARYNLKNMSFEEQGLSSLDVIELALILEQQTGYTHLRGNILVTDTPFNVAQYFLVKYQSGLIKEVFNHSDTCQVISLGQPLSVMHHKLKGSAHVLHGDYIEGQSRPFSIAVLAEQMFQQEKHVFQQHKARWIVAYSIHALLAIALCHVCEKNNISIQGLFLLDPPHLKRQKQLRRKVFLLKARQKLLKKMINYNVYHNTERYRYELRKLAIASHGTHEIKTKTLLVHTDVQTKESPWLTSDTSVTSVLLSDVEHLALIKTEQGLETWFSYMYEFLGLS